MSSISQNSPQTLTPNQAIERMIDLRIQQAKLKQQIQALKPAFFEACSQQDTDQIKNGRAFIFCKLTPGKWNYSTNIINHERKLKQLKKDFQENHEPNTGREVFWVNSLMTQKTSFC
jgi:hypothetical protein